MPHYFRPGLYEMDRSSLERRLKRANLVIGDIRETCMTFLQKYKPAPIGCMLHDLDYYSSTRDALALFDGEASYFSAASIYVLRRYNRRRYVAMQRIYWRTIGD